MSDITFYTNPQSRGQIVRWMLEEVGEPYETQVVEYGEQMKSADFLAINPMGKVPVVVHKNQVATECAAICAYLASAFPEKNLGPAEGDEAAYFRWMFFAAGPLETAVLNRSMGWEPKEKQQATAGYGSYELTLATLEDFLSNTAYVSGDSFTAADVYVGSHLDFGLMFGTIEPRESFTRYVENLRNRDAYKLAKQKDMALMPES